MIDCEKEIKKYWDEEVKLSEDDVGVLRGNRDENIKKLKKRLMDDSFPLHKEEINQGSYSMKTIIQHPRNDYDIDVGIVFKEDDLQKKGKNNPLEIRKYIAEIMKDDRFNKQPDYKKNCVRVYYNDGHHIDMPIYKEYKNENKTIQELASSLWEESDPKSINKWFVKRKEEKSELKKIVQLFKKWARSRNSWSLPSGLILTILANEKYVSYYSRLDEKFYWTLKALKDRLKYDKKVFNPTNNDEITSSDKHSVKVNNLTKRLDEMFVFLEELETTSDKKKVLLIWKRFFNDDFFVNQVKEIKEATITNTNQPWLKQFDRKN